MKNVNKIAKKIFSNRFFLLGVVPVLLLLFWFFASLSFNNKISFSVLLYKHSNSAITQLPKNTLLKGDKIKGEFRAKDDYLGLVMLRFAEYAKHDFSGEDLLVFRLKQKGDKGWYYSNTYRSGLLNNNLSLLFGFPIITDSKNKTYEFELESLSGNKTNGVEINRNSTALFSGYQYPKSEIIKNRRSTLKFIFKKIITSFTNSDFLLSSILYLFPLLVYLAIYMFSSSGKGLNNFRHVITTLISVLILVDIFRIKEIYLGVIVLLILGWIFTAVINKNGSRFSFIFAISLILLWVLLMALRINDFQNKINVWVYMLFIIGLFQAVFEEKK